MNIHSVCCVGSVRMVRVLFQRSTLLAELRVSRELGAGTKAGGKAKARVGP